MNIASALLKQVVIQQDLDTWSQVKEIYLPNEYRGIFNILEKHVDNYQSLPTFAELKAGQRDQNIQEKLSAIESIEVEVDADMLLDYLKNEYTQTEILDELDKYVDKTVTMASAEENIEQLQEIVLNVSDKVDVTPPSESMQTITLFEDDEQRKCDSTLLEHDESSDMISVTQVVLVSEEKGGDQEAATGTINGSNSNLFAAFCED